MFSYWLYFSQFLSFLFFSFVHFTLCTICFFILFFNSQIHSFFYCQNWYHLNQTSNTNHANTLHSIKCAIFYRYLIDLSLLFRAYQLTDNYNLLIYHSVVGSQKSIINLCLDTIQHRGARILPQIYVDVVGNLVCQSNLQQLNLFIS